MFSCWCFRLRLLLCYFTLGFCFLYGPHHVEVFFLVHTEAIHVQKYKVYL